MKNDDNEEDDAIKLEDVTTTHVVFSESFGTVFVSNFFHCLNLRNTRLSSIFLYFPGLHCRRLPIVLVNWDAAVFFPSL